MNEKVLVAYCRMRNGAHALRERIAETLHPEQPEMLYDPRPFSPEAGLSKLAITVILVAVGVGLTLGVVAILGPAIMNLAGQTGSQIESVPMDWGP